MGVGFPIGVGNEGRDPLSLRQLPLQGGAGGGKSEDQGQVRVVSG